MAQFNNEYIALSAPSDLEKAFDVRITTTLAEDHPVPFTEYQKWQHCKKPRSFAVLLSRESLETWLYRLFLKIAIPEERRMRDYTPIYSPLNLSVFIRLCGHLRSNGYPAHWLSGVLSSIVSGKISSRARPPRSLPLKIREVRAKMPVLERSTAPFVAEMTTLLSMYQISLSFGVLAPQLPTIDAVRKYAYTLDEVPLHPVPEPNHFVLVFFDAYDLKPNTIDLRHYLLSDETADDSSQAERIRERGLHILTTWNWDRAGKPVTFWLRQDVMEEMKKGVWAVSIWRTDNWDYQSKPCNVSEVKDMGATWAEC